MGIILIILYVALMLINLYKSLQHKDSVFLYFLSFLLLVILMCGHLYTGTGDSTDLYYYERDYSNVLTQYNIQDYSLYYLFWGTQVLGNILGLSYHSWWMIMTILSLLAVYKFINDNKCNRNFCIFVFMFYAVALYTGLKYYYGLCVLLLGIKYLIRNLKRDKLKFVLFVLLASGFHAMYYLFLILVLIDMPLLTPKLIFQVSIVLFVAILLIGRSFFVTVVQSILVPILKNFGITRFVYFQDNTNLGVFVPIALHIVTLFYSYTYYKIVKYEKKDELYMNANRILRVNQIMVLIYPLYLFAVTFARLNTVISLITLFLSSVHYSEFSYRSRKRLLLCEIIVLVVFGLYFYGVCGYFDYNLKPMFDINAFK